MFLVFVNFFFTSLSCILVSHHTFFFFFADNTFVLLNGYVFYCQSQGWNNEGRQLSRLGLVVLQTNRLFLHLAGEPGKKRQNKDTSQGSKQRSPRALCTV